MALQLTNEQSSGVSGNYWKVATIRISTEDSRAEVGVALYKDSAARQAAKSPLSYKGYILSGYTAAAMDDSNPIALTYTKLKTLDEFAGAQDV